MKNYSFVYDNYKFVYDYAQYIVSTQKEQTDCFTESRIERVNKILACFDRELMTVQEAMQLLHDVPYYRDFDGTLKAFQDMTGATIDIRTRTIHWDSTAETTCDSFESLKNELDYYIDHVAGGAVK